MKKLFSLVLILSLGVLLVAGCSSTSSGGGGDPTVPASTVASDLGTMGKNSLALDNGILGVISVAGASGAKAMAPTTPTYSSSWWTSTDSYSSSGLTYDITYKFRVWDTNGTEITTLQGLAAISSALDISALWTYTTITYTFSGGSYSISYGSSTSDPLKWSGYNTSSHTISGPLSFSSSYSGTSYGITITYSSLTLSGGYPSGNVTVSITEDGSEVAAGSIAFNGTNLATVTFTSGLSGTYTVNLDTGLVVSGL